MVNYYPNLMDFAKTTGEEKNPKPLDYKARLLGMSFVLLFRSV